MPLSNAQLVFDAALQLDSVVDVQLLQGSVYGVRPDDAEQKVRREVARGRDHVIRQLIDAHHLADRVVHGRVRVAPGLDAEGHALDDAEKSIAHVNARMGKQIAAVDRREHAQKYRNLDRARRVEPAVGLVVQLEPGLGVVKGDADRFRPGFLFDLRDLRCERALARGHR